ncbi:hypothetical protein [Streptomyces sp. N35]|uniref:hypothetical protein n=1 Tax=Streptomyces sp. N35 TaxID=2795730 RepID=UPI0018F547D7|nr:hypothetical protein [Streptomyces sp. N35]
MSRPPLNRVERTKFNRRKWQLDEAKKARESRGDTGAMEFWLRVTRADISRELKAGRADVLHAFTQVLRLFRVALARRADGDPRLLNDLLAYAQQVLDKHPDY